MLKQLVILAMRADPELVDMIYLSQSQRPIADPDPDRVDWLPSADPFELETCVVRIRTLEHIWGCLLLNYNGKPVKSLPKLLRDA